MMTCRRPIQARGAAQLAENESRRRGRVRSFFANLGPGLITGAADDDPSGISTYSTAGAGYGFGLLSGRGLASVLRHYYSRRLLWFACLLLVISNTVTIAADLGGMAEAAELMTGVPSLIFTPLFAGVILLLLFFPLTSR